MVPTTTTTTTTMMGIIIIVSMGIISSSSSSSTMAVKFSTILVFGDSTVDTGNNNYVRTAFKSNHLPYGQDFPTHLPTGRFSDGKLIPDFVATSLGIKLTVPPFLDPALSDEDVLTGVSFASAGSGYDDITTALIGVIPVSKQLEMFNKYITRLKSILGDDQKANSTIGDALFIVSAGTNDFTFNYYDAPTRRSQFKNMTAYQDFLLCKVQNFVKELYYQGGRTMAIAGLPPIGCLPIQMTTRFQNAEDRKCLEDQNSDSQSYNKKLVILLSQLESSLPGSMIAYANVYDPLLDMVTQPQKFGFVETTKGCCGTGFVEAASLCHAATPMCRTPSEYLFWDCIHPTQSAYKSLSDQLVKQLLPAALPPN